MNASQKRSFNANKVAIPGVFLIMALVLLMAGCGPYHKPAARVKAEPVQFEPRTIPHYRTALWPKMTIAEAVKKMADRSATEYMRSRLAFELAEQFHHYAKIQDLKGFERMKDALLESYDPSAFARIEGILTGKFLDDVDRAAGWIDRVTDAATGAGIAGGLGGFGDIDFGSAAVDAEPSPIKQTMQHNIDTFDDTPPNKSMDTDTDGDGYPDWGDIDNDGDGYSDALEKKEGTDPDDPEDHPSGKKDVEDNDWDEDEDDDEETDLYPGPGCPGRPADCFGLLLDGIYDVRGLINDLISTYLNIAYDIDQVLDTVPELGTEKSTQGVIWLYR